MDLNIANALFSCVLGIATLWVTYLRSRDEKRLTSLAEGFEEAKKKIVMQDAEIVKLVGEHQACREENAAFRVQVGYLQSTVDRLSVVAKGTA